MKALSYLNKYFVKYKWRMLLGILFIICSNYFGVKMPLFVKNTVDDIMTTQQAEGLNDALLLSLQIGGIYMLLSLGKGFFLFLTRQTIIVTSRYIEFDLKNEIYNQYQRLSYNFYKKNNTGDIMNRISEDVTQVRQYLGPGIMYTINLAVLFTLVISEMIAINAQLTLFVLLPLPLMSIVIYKVSSKMNAMSAEVQKQQSLISTLVQESFSGIRILKAYTQEDHNRANFDENTENYKDKQMKLVLINSLFMPTIILLIGLSTILAIYLGGLMTYKGELSLGEILAFIIFVNMLTWPFASVGWVTSIIQRASASQERINEFLQENPEIVNENSDDFTFQGKIEFKNVSYTYPNSGIKALDNVSFIVKKGETLGIVGSTGSGKTTILNLLMRQFDPDTGNIFVDGIDLKEVNLDALRNQSAVIPQEVFLFSDTIANNIKFGSTDLKINREAIEESTKKSHVHHNIIDFPDSFDTLLGERGVNLSGGQKQRVSIARALLRNPKLLLMDDCFSAVDTETEEIILSNLAKEIGNKTAIIVSHRISSLRNADAIIVLDGHQITEKGTHEELIEIGKIYAEMYERQLAEEVN
ncbi:ABC transporter ATP-binding protein/permease [Crocinitomicaceae bacterium]|nr:ABC transporter ATP-binding protein/permease [Crocinitomicaceae bacterium]